MQDQTTGDMVGIEPGNKEYFVKEGIADRDSIEFNAEKIAKDAERRGYCVLSIGEKVDINGGNFKVLSLDKKQISFECPENVFDLKIKNDEPVKIKNGNFVIQHYGKGQLFVRGLPGNRILDQQILDDIRKAKIDAMRKEQSETTKPISTQV